MLFDFKIEGNLGNDPELRETRDGKKVAQMRVGRTSRRFKDGEWADAHTTWVTVTAWEGLAERCMSLKKGDTVLVVGRDDLRPWAYNRRADGEAAAELQVTASNVSLSMRFKSAESLEPENAPWTVDDLTVPEPEYA
ncbi:single-stranded DNA-binding protein [Actinoplanes flavus]|uniref:Single-stranded DNA-binding protein n=1 Tax=Actinoplanes flavus TaxID=2820290 RepID=A0ABS3UCZ4_9ACTN|nr:single-stranded DNA-binding protein [Actinoplanes flavus]MBO3736654.1 single-stranded DNA-binding protein [Actinoplanes flavus]